MFLRFGHYVQRHRWWIIAIWAVALAISVPLAPRLTSTLKSGGFSSDDLEAVQARKLVEQRLGLHANTLVAVFQSQTMTADEPRFQAAVERTLAPLQALPGVVQVIPPAMNPRQVSPDRHTAYAVIALAPPAEGSRRLLAEVQRRLHDDDLAVLVSGAPVFYADIEDVSERDLRRAELVAFPLGLLTLLLVLRSVVAAAVAVAAGGAGVAAALATLFLVGQAVDLSIFVLNMATMLGLGLSIDYALFLTSRFREELQRHDPGEAVATTVGTAGRAVFFSAVTVLTGLLGLITFDAVMLRSLGIGGAVVVGIAGLAALTLLPALLAVLGRRVNALALPALPGLGHFSWARLATAVMLHPVAVALPVLALLLVLGWPFLGVRLGSPDASILPAGMPSRQGFEVLQREFGDGELAPIMVVVQSRGNILAPDNLAALYDLTHQLAQDSRVERVESIVDLDSRITKEQYQLLYADPDRVADPYAHATLAALVRGDTTLVRVVGKYPMISAESQDLVRSIRRGAPPGGFTLLVGGGSAAILDHVANLYANVPRAVALVVLTTYLALFLLFRSVLLPLKAILMNTLSILASYGALVVVFQEGHFSNLLGFTPAGFVEASLPIVMFCFLFGVSMDYEVFLLSRVKEAYERSGDNTRSVAEGLERSGRIITSAALIVVVVSVSFVAADIVLIKALGLGTAVAVFLDATIVRALLVPATMRLLGDLNWWLPTSSCLSLFRSALRYGVPAIAVGATCAVLLWGVVGAAIAPHAASNTVAGPAATDNRPASKPLPPIALPDDEAPHDNLSEWWYYTGHLTADDGVGYGFEFVTFQSVRGSAPVGYAAHLAITDRARRAFRYDHRSTTGSQLGQRDGFALQVGDWRMGGANGQDRLSAAMNGYGLALDLQASKPPALHMGKGIVSFGPAGDSYYYSRTRLAATGTLSVDGLAKPVNGSAWMDHQWGNFLVLDQGGWDWFGLQFDDGSDLAISLVRSAEGPAVLVYATYVDPAGRTTHLPGSAFSVTATGQWTSPHSGARYPAGWHVAVPELDLALDVAPVLADQELDTRQSTGVIYWEGEARLAGKRHGRPIAGLGYVELTGYAANSVERR